MSDNSVTTCDLCGRLVVKGQSMCACGARVSFGSVAAGDKAPFDYSKLLPIIPAIGFLLFVYLIARPSAVMFSSMPIVKAVLITFISSAAVAVLVADRARKDDWPLADTRFTTFSPTSWFAAVLLLWPVFFPAFLKVHLERTNPQRMKLAYAAVVAFILAWMWVSFFVRNSLPQPSAKSSSPSTRSASPETPSRVNPAATTVEITPSASPAAGTMQTAATQPPSNPAGSSVPAVPGNSTPQRALNLNAPTARPPAPRSNRQSPPSDSEPQYGVDILGRK